MAKRIKIYFPDGKDQIEIPDDKIWINILQMVLKLIKSF